MQSSAIPNNHIRHMRDRRNYPPIDFVRRGAEKASMLLVANSSMWRWEVRCGYLGSYSYSYSLSSLNWFCEGILEKDDGNNPRTKGFNIFPAL